MGVSIYRTRSSRLWFGALLCILLAISPLHAKISSIAVGMGNDWVSMGLGNNKDDGHSFSLIADLSFDSGAYFRFVMEGVTDQQSAQHERYDSATLTASYPLRFVDREMFRLSLTPHLGVTLVGELGLDQVQNLLHSTLSHDLVNVPWAFDSIEAFPYFGATLTTEVPWRRLLFDVTLSTAQTAAWESDVSATVGVTLNRFLTLATGYSYQWSHSDSSAQMLKVQEYRGPLFSLTYDAYFVKTSWFTFLDSGFSFGHFTFNPLAFWEKPRYVSEDITLLAGIAYDWHLLQTRIVAFRYKSVALTVHYSSGRLEAASPYRRNIGSWTVGKLFSLNKPEAWLRPSVQIYGGVKRLNLVKSYTDVVIEEARPTVGVQLGVAFGRSPGWIIGNTAYQFRLLVDLSHTLFTNSLHIGVPSWEAIGAPPFTALIGLVLEVSHDLDQ